MDEKKIAENGHESVEWPDDAMLAEGEWVKPYGIPIPGLEVLLCQYGTKEGNLLALRGVKKFGGPRTSNLDDLKPEKRQAALAWIMSRGHFKAMRIDGDLKGQFEMRPPGTAKGDGRMFTNTFGDREFLVTNYKLWRETIDNEISALGEAEQEHMEGVAGN